MWFWAAPGAARDDHACEASRGRRCRRSPSARRRVGRPPRCRCRRHRSGRCEVKSGAKAIESSPCSFTCARLSGRRAPPSRCRRRRWWRPAADSCDSPILLDDVDPVLVVGVRGDVGRLREAPDRIEAHRRRVAGAQRGSARHSASAVMRLGLRLMPNGYRPPRRTMRHRRDSAWPGWPVPRPGRARRRSSPMRTSSPGSKPGGEAR